MSRVASLSCLASLLFASGGAEAEQILEIPVSLEVENRNLSRVACPADGLAYTVSGTLVGPHAALAGGAPRVITLYLHGFSVAAWNWTFDAVEGYDTLQEMARLGHVSLAIDRVGFGASGFPVGFETCFGSAADVAQQVVTHLRDGTYRRDDGAAAPAFDTVVVLGHDTGAQIAQIQAYSFQDVDGLIVTGFNDTGFTPTVTQWSGEASAICAQGGEPAEPSGPDGYHRFPARSKQQLRDDPELQRATFPTADQAVIDAVIELSSSNPCGDLMSVPTSVATDLALLSEVTAPVLIIYTDLDVGFSQEGGERHESFFGGSPDASSVFLENTGHFLMFERSAPIFRRVVSDWLCTRGLVSAGSDCDLDDDGVLDPFDNCRYTPNPDQMDRGGIATSGPDGIGDVCQCGDVNDDGLVNGNDATLITFACINYQSGFPERCSRSQADPRFVWEKCSVGADPAGQRGLCNGNDSTLIFRAALGLDPGIQNACPAYAP